MHPFSGGYFVHFAGNCIMIIYKKDIMSELKDKGYTSYRLRHEKIMSEKNMTNIRNKKVTMAVLNQICQLLDCQPGEILEYLPDDKSADQ